MQMHACFIQQTHNTYKIIYTTSISIKKKLRRSTQIGNLTCKRIIAVPSPGHEPIMLLY